MRVLLVAWEPVATPRVPTWPRLRAAAAALRATGTQVRVLADATTLRRCELDDRVDRVVAHEAAPYLDLGEPRTMALAGGIALQSAGHATTAEADVVHAVGWTATHGAVHLARLAGRPLVASLLSMPPPGPPDAGSTFAHQTRWWLTYEAQAVVTGSARLRDRVVRAYRKPSDAVSVAPYPRGSTGPVDLDGLARVLTAAHEAAVRLAPSRTPPRAEVPRHLRLAPD